MIGIIDYGMGNLHSVQNACSHLHLDSLISADPAVLASCDRLILPGVGAFGDMMDHLEQTGLDGFIKEQVRKEKKPLLGICLGMQALFESSEENGLRDGFGFLQGKVRAMEPFGIRIPEIGWNELVVADSHPLKEMLSEKPFAYYDHSYYASEWNPSDLVACSHYGPYTVCGLVEKENVMGAQFHPEKSGKDGLRILEYFAKEFCV